MAEYWNGGVGTWETAGDWSLGQSPTWSNADFADVSIAAAGSKVTTTADEEICTLAISTGNILTINGYMNLDGDLYGQIDPILNNSGTIIINSKSLNIDGAGLVFNFGVVIIEAGAAVLYDDAVGMQGSGTMQLVGGAISTTGSIKDPVMENVAQTISGFGQIQGSFINDAAGVIDANVALRVLTIGNNQVSEAAFVNKGLIEATSDPSDAVDYTYLNVAEIVDNYGVIAAKGDGFVDVLSGGIIVGGSVMVQDSGVLSISGILTDIDPSNNAIVALNVTASGSAEIDVIDDLVGANVHLSEQAVIVISGRVIGGSLSTSDNAIIYGYGGTLDGSTASGAVTLSGSTQVNTISGDDDYNNSLTLLGVIDNTGTITLTSTDTTVRLLAGNSIVKTVTLQGGGHIVMSDDDNTFIDGGVQGATLTNVDNTISGNGTIGTGYLIFNNAGTVDATGLSPMYVQLSNSVSTNSGNMEATAGGDLEFVRGDIDNTRYVLSDDAFVEINRLVTFANNGVVSATDGGVISIGAAAGNKEYFTNLASGSVQATLGGKITIGANASSNDVGGTLTGGSWTAGSVSDTTISTLTFADAFTKLSASLFVAGQGQVVDGGASLETRLTDIAAGGTLGVGRAYTTANAISVEGTLRLNGGTFTSGLVTATGGISGNGTLASALNSSGGVSVFGLPLYLTGADTLSGAISGLGTVAFRGNTVTLNAGAAFNAAAITFTNSTVAINANVVQAAKSGPATTSFTETTSALTITSGDTLNFVSAATFKGGSVGGAGMLEFSGAATANFQSGVTLSVANIWETGTASLTISEALAYGGAFKQDTGAKLTVVAGQTLTLSGGASFAGSTTGGGTLALTGGIDTISGGAAFSVANWKLSGAATILNVGVALSYGGIFSATTGATINLTGGFSLNGAATLTNATVSASSLEILHLNKTAVVGNLSITGMAELASAGATTESGGGVKVGDSVATDKAMLYNATSGVWNITDNSGIAIGADAASALLNSGVFEKTGGTGVSTIATGVSNSGKLLAASGTLDFKAAVWGTGAATISGASVLEFDAGVVATQTVGFTGAGGELALHAPIGFKAEISGFDAGGATGDAIALLGNWTLGHFTENTGGTGGTLALTSGATALTLNFLGQYQDGHFHGATAGGQTTLTYS